MARRWFPIETAPKDGTTVELAPSMDESKEWSLGHWNELYGGLWYMNEVGTLLGHWKPTKWRPVKKG